MPSFAPMVYIERAVLDPMGRRLFATTLTTEEPSTAQVALTEQAVLAPTALRSCADHIRYTRNDREWIEARDGCIRTPPRASLAGRIAALHHRRFRPACGGSRCFCGGNGLGFRLQPLRGCRRLRRLRADLGDNAPLHIWTCAESR